MSKPTSRIHTNGAYVIKSAESLPRPVTATASLNGRAPAVTLADRQLARAVLQRHRS